MQTADLWGFMPKTKTKAERNHIISILFHMLSCELVMIPNY